MPERRSDSTSALREPRNQRRASAERMDIVFNQIGRHLREGRSGEAERLINNSLQSYRFSDDSLAHLKRLLSFTLETTGRYKESLDAVRPYEDEVNLDSLGADARVRVTTQLGIAYSNAGDQPKAVTILKDNKKRARNEQLSSSYGSIDIGLARVYRKLGQYPICRDHAMKALESYRENGDWLGMAEAYREIANSYHQEGDSESAVANFQLGIKIIGENSAPFMLGKLYTDMSGAYWFLRKPLEGIECLERSLEFFDETEHALNSLIAYGNLGINLILIGEWQRAENMLERALEIGLRENYVHVAGLYDSLGELALLRERFEDAESFLDSALDVAERYNHNWYRLQAMRNRARLYLVTGEPEEATALANETIALAAEAGDKHYSNMAGLVLAESYLALGDNDLCEEAIEAIEANDARSDFFVLGSIQRIKGLMALSDGDNELAIHHFNRALTTFEAAQDLFHTGLIRFLLGANLGSTNLVRARDELGTAERIFRKLGVSSLLDKTDEELRKLDERPQHKSVAQRSNSVVSQLLTVRLAEATASRELIFRELSAVLQQESNAKKLVIAEHSEEGAMQAFITHGYSPQESAELVSHLVHAQEKGTEKAFLRTRNIAVFPLRGSAAPPAMLIVHPSAGATLSDGTSFGPLLRVVELGMDVVALRDRDRVQHSTPELSPYTSNTLMPGFIHSSPAMTSLVEEVYKIRSSDVTVLVTGESGTGKELVSRAIHTLSNRKDKVFVPFNCTAIPKELAEGHLFGYRKGSFTGATADSPGVIRSADGGTLFLDEVGDLPIDVQPKLLRFLQEGEIQPLGEKHPIKVDVRIIAATNMPLEDKVADGSFREDLYYRLNVIRLRVPPLRERRSEIPPIVTYYTNHYSARFNKHDVTFAPQTLDLLMVCDWEGNVRQLCNEVQRIIARAEDGEVITPDHLSADLKRATRPLTPFGEPRASKPITTYDGGIMPFVNINEGSTLEEAVSELEMQLIRASLAKQNWNISRVAAELGLTRRGLYLKLARYGIKKAV
ncbi:MAG: sigma 54-interacting transcriptional regulator [Chloracidobacterium sp.]|nr:sigma 54-interacting transcriptional regulator [Chloracidobacterium sp.]